MRILLACVPFGCDNIGDEAILECVVKIMRRNFPDASITVATARPTDTVALLNVEAVGLLGFDNLIGASEISAQILKHDMLVWAGATGLSDYPDTAIKILDEASRAGLKTVMWGVGMDSVLNPAFFKLGGRKKKLCKALSRLSLGTVNFEAIAESSMDRAARRRISKSLSECDLVVLRDSQSEAELMKYPPKTKIVVGADSAIEMSPPQARDLDFLSPELKGVLTSDKKKIGVCISAQRKIDNLGKLAEVFDELLEDGNSEMLFIPMNPITDSRLMREIRSKMKSKARAHGVDNCLLPSMVQAVAQKCDAVVSSRLHLLILSANVSTPIVGISRGSKLDNFLSPFGLKTCGSVSDFDADALKREVRRFLKEGKSEFARRRDEVYASLNSRMKSAEELLRRI